MSESLSNNEETNRPCALKGPRGADEASKYTVVSYVLMAVATIAVLHFALLSAVIAGLAVYVLTLKLVRRHLFKTNRFTHKVALGIVVMIVIGVLASAVAAIWSFLGSDHGISALLKTLVDTLGYLHTALPPTVSEAFPTTIEELQQLLIEMFGSHARKISSVGLEGLKVSAHIILGMVVGGMVAVHHFDAPSAAPPFICALRTRLRLLAEAFDKVVFAQAQISGINAALTAVYLLGILPLWGIHLPMAGILVLLTFAVGLLPVVGNLISNTVIVIISLGVSVGVGIASLVFLVLIHKAEYFLNARIVGNEVKATVWELLSAMLLLEAIFGPAGLITAPVLYAWVKSEIREQGLI